jgi:hypothetical protein
MPGAARFNKSLPDGPPLFLIDSAVLFGTARPTAASDGVDTRPDVTAWSAPVCAHRALPPRTGT